MENDSDNDKTATTSGTPSSAANNDNTATTSRTASAAANFATTLRTASSAAANNDNTATTSRTASNTATASRTASNARSCAACTYQRRKCTADCILAPYFPQHRHKQFANAHRLFGVSTIIRIIKDLDPISRDDAMISIQYESDARARDPVGGCYGIILKLRSQIAQQEHELNVIRQQLDFYRAQFFSVQMMMMPQPQQNHPCFQYQIPPLMLQDDQKEQEDENKEPK